MRAYKAVGNYDAMKSGAALPASGTYPASGHAFIYDSATAKFSTLEFPGSISSTAYGIWMDGNAVAIAGGYTDKNGTHAYVRNLAGTKMLVYDWPKSILTHFEGITGAGGSGNYNVIGDYFDLKNKTLEYGFFLPIRNWTAGTATVIGPVSANSVYGQHRHRRLRRRRPNQRVYHEDPVKRAGLRFAPTMELSATGRNSAVRFHCRSSGGFL